MYLLQPSNPTILGQEKCNVTEVQDKDLNHYHDYVQGS